MASFIQKNLIGTITLVPDVDEPVYVFSANQLVGNVVNSTVRINVVTKTPLTIQLPLISEFGDSYEDLLIIITDVSFNAQASPIAVTVGQSLEEVNSFQGLSGFGYMDKNGQSTTFRIVNEELWVVGGDGLTFGG